MKAFTLPRVSRYATVTATLLTLIAIALYPGGTVLNPATKGYTFFQNSLSDLGATVASNGQPNPGWLIHLAASVSLVLASTGCLVALMQIYSTSPLTSWLARLAGTMVLLAGVGVIGAALAPHDRFAVLALALPVTLQKVVAVVLVVIVVLQDYEAGRARIATASAPEAV